MKSHTLRILAIEDNPADFRLLKEYLREDASMDFEIVQAGTLSDALKLLTTEDFAVTLLDLNLPDSRGLYGLESILLAKPALPVIVLTGLEDEEMGLRALSKDAQDYLVKGKIDSHILIRSIRYAIERDKAERAVRKLNSELERHVAELRVANESLRASRLAALNLTEDAVTARQRAEQAGVELARALEQRRLALEAARLGTFDYDPRTGQLTWDEQTKRLYGVAVDKQPHYAEALQQVHAQDRERVAKALQAAFEPGASGKFESEHRIVWPDGSVHWAIAIGQTYVDGDGSQRLGDRMIGVHLDVTELKEAQQQHSLILASALNGYWVADSQGRFREVNDALCRMLGYSSEELITMGIQDIEAVEGPAEVLERIAALKQKGSEHRESQHRRKDGTVIEVEINATWLEAHGGEVVSFVQDITDRKRSERALRESEERLLLAQKAGDVGVFDWNLLTETGVWTDELKAMYGVPADFRETLSAWSLLVHPADLKHLEEERTRAIHAQRREIESEYRIVRSDGKVRWLADQGVISYDASGNPARMIGTTIDITEKKEAEEKLRQVEQRYRTSAGHVIRTLVLSIFVVEFAVMVFLDLIHPLSMITEAILDGLLMLTLLSPTLYRLVFRPLLQLIKEREHAEAALRQSHGDLELRVKDRTARLENSNKKLEEEIVVRKRAEEETARSLRNIEFISEAATRFLKEQTYPQVFEYIAQQISRLMGDGFVVVGEYDPADKCIVIRSIGGDEHAFQSVADDLGQEPIGLRLKFDPAAMEKMVRGTLVSVDGGLRELSCGQLPETVCQQITQRLHLGDIYAIPFAVGEDILGTVALLTAGEGLPENARVIETFVSQAAVALERLRTEESLRLREREYRQLMEEAADGIVLATAEGRLIAANSRAMEMLGYDMEEMTHLNPRELIPDEDRPVLTVCLEDIKAGKTATLEHRVVKKDGSCAFVETSAKKLADGRYQGILRDITERKRSEEEFTKAVKTQVFDRLFASLREFHHGEGVAMNLHRIALFARNVASLMQESGMTTEKSPGARFEVAVHEFATVGYEKLRGLGSLVRAVQDEINRKASSGEDQVSGSELLRLSEFLKSDSETLLHVAGGEHPPGESPFDVGGRLAGSIEKLFNQIGDIRRRLDAHFTSNLSQVIGAVVAPFQSVTTDVTIEVQEETRDIKAIISPSDLSEVLSLLINNALDALAGKGSAPVMRKRRIRVCAMATGPTAKIVVEDSGGGVPPNIRDRIFTSGFTTKGSGHGYGLTYARDHLSKYGGALSYDDQYLEGARFTVELVRA